MSKHWSGVTATVVAALVLLACGGVAPESDASTADGPGSTKADFYYQCGDGSCDGNEPTTCPADCAGLCGDGYCAPYENTSTCPSDCWSGPICGNGVCESGEHPGNCSFDCWLSPTSCGDGICDAGENSNMCPQDCGSCRMSSSPTREVPPDGAFYYQCGDGSCDGNERVTCPADCCA
nr:hypothetical protein MFMH1_38200 [Myxococcus sp. MH1]